MPCNTIINFKLDGSILAAPPTINNITAMQPLFIDGSALCTLCNDNFFVEIVESDMAGAPLPNATAISEWVSKATMYDLSIGNYDVRDLCRRNNYTLDCNKYFRLKLASGPVWTERTYILHTPASCPINNNSFDLIRDAFNFVPNDNCLNLRDHSYQIYAPLSFSCNYSFFITVQECVGPSHTLVGVEAGGWLTTDQIHMMHDYGSLDLETFAFNGGLTMSNQHDYQIKFAAGYGSCSGGQWVENRKYFSCTDICIGRMAEINISTEVDLMNLFPNPANNILNIEFRSIQENTSVQIIDMIGQVVFDMSEIDNNKISLDISTLSNGIYFVQAIGNNERLATKKLVIQH